MTTHLQTVAAPSPALMGEIEFLGWLGQAEPGDVLDSIAKTELATLSTEEWSTFVECIVTGYCDQLRDLAAADRGRAMGAPF